MPPEKFLDLSRGHQVDILEEGAERTGRPAFLLEKDVWVVRCLEVLWKQDFARHLVFKGGTSLSKAYRAIDRFSEDVDLTYDIRQLVPGLSPNDRPEPPSRSQAQKWTKFVKEALPEWVRTRVLPILKEQIAGASVSLGESDRCTVLVGYEPFSASSSYVRNAVQLEFGGRATGEPCSERPITCDLEPVFPRIAFPAATPRVMHAERTFWEKATAVHVYCVSGRFRGRQAFARHWYDLMMLGAAGIGTKALDDRDLAWDVAQHKSLFFREKDDAGEQVDYQRVVSGELRLVPKRDEWAEVLRSDYLKMIAEGFLESTAPAFDELMVAIRGIEESANRAR